MFRRLWILMMHRESSDPKSAQISDFWAGCHIGASHLAQGKNCQDAQATEFGYIDGIPYAIASVADGHGQSQYDMSEYGAQIAVSCATDVMREIASRYAGSERVHLVRSIKSDFPRLVTRRWREKIREDAQTRGLDTSDSLTMATRYGTTLISALYIRDVLLCAQIGDGDVILVNHDGEPNRIFLENQAMLGNETLSLSSPSAHLIWKTTAVSPVDGLYLFLSSDGLSDSFNAQEASRYEEWLRRLVICLEDYGFSEVTPRIPGWFRDISRQGAGDDISLIILKLKNTAENIRNRTDRSG